MGETASVIMVLPLRLVGGGRDICATRMSRPARRHSQGGSRDGAVRREPGGMSAHPARTGQGRITMSQPCTSLVTSRRERRGLMVEAAQDAAARQQAAPAARSGHRRPGITMSITCCSDVPRPLVAGAGIDCIAGSRTDHSRPGAEQEGCHPWRAKRTSSHLSRRPADQKEPRPLWRLCRCEKV